MSLGYFTTTFVVCLFGKKVLKKKVFSLNADLSENIGRPTYMEVSGPTCKKKRLLCIYLDFKFEIESKLIRIRAKRDDESTRRPNIKVCLK